MRKELLLLIAIMVLACNKQRELSINWENGKAVSVTVPVPDSVFVYLDDTDIEMLGSQDIGGDVTVFTPAVPFQRGQSYHISSAGKNFTIAIPRDTTATTPRLVRSYPSCDTVPENLLKVYLQFDQPMMEGRSASHVFLLDATGDTIKGAFLDLQPELWNEDQTVLTLWLDPGRIKQDLIPNRALGPVLIKGREYRLVVKSGWRSKAGLKAEEYVRTFLTKERDATKPDVVTWNVLASSTDVIVDVGEPLDWSLLNSTMWIRRGKEKIPVKISTIECERRVRLTPIESLTAGEYTIEIEGRLEDLAGNNLNRLFETDVTEGDRVSNEKHTHTLTFNVR